MITTRSPHASRGIILVNVLVFAMIAVIVLTALITWAAIVLRNSKQLAAREEAFAISEAGIDYYRWHLAHAQADYTDGNATSTPSPYIHDFQDKDGNVIGHFELTITPPSVGSTIVKIQSKGTVVSDPSVYRTIQVTVAIPSIAKYAFVTNSVVYYGSGDEVFGTIHSNVGVGFLNGSPQPKAHGLVTSAASTFNGNFGVYTTVPSADPAPPAAVPNRADVFLGGRQFPVPTVDFNSITSDLSSIKAAAQLPAGFYRAASGALGYKIVLKTTGTFDLYKVNSLLPAPGGCTNSQNQTGWGTWSINTSGSPTTFLGTYSYPTNGQMFFEDNIWVEGQINKNRLTIAAGTFPTNPSTYKNIIVNNDLKYTNFDGQDVVGLIAQGNFLVGLSSASNLTIDAAVVAQNGQTIRYYYGSNCPSHLRTTLTTYGMFASNGQGYFYYGDGISGYTSQPASYDANLLYGPPPNFPLTSDQYTTISWTEVNN